MSFDAENDQLMEGEDGLNAFPNLYVRRGFHSLLHAKTNELQWNWLGAITSKSVPVYLIGYGDLDLVEYEVSSLDAANTSKARHLHSSVSTPTQTILTLVHRFEEKLVEGFESEEERTHRAKSREQRILFVGPGWCLEVSSVPCSCCFGQIEQFSGQTVAAGLDGSTHVPSENTSLWILDGLDADAHRKVKLTMEKLLTMKKLLDIEETTHTVVKEARKVYYEGKGNPAKPPGLLFLLSYPILACAYIGVQYEIMNLDQAYPIAAVASTVLAYEGLELSSISGIAVLAITNTFPRIMEPYFGIGAVQETVIYIMVTAAVVSLLFVLLKDELDAKKRFVLVPKKNWPSIQDNITLDFVFCYNQIVFHDGMHCRLKRHLSASDYMPQFLQSRLSGLFSTIGMIGIDGETLCSFCSLCSRTIVRQQKAVDSAALPKNMRPLLSFESKRVWLCNFVYELTWGVLTVLILASRFLTACVALACVCLYFIHSLALLISDLMFLGLLYLLAAIYVVYRNIGALCFYICRAREDCFVDCVVDIPDHHANNDDGEAVPRSNDEAAQETWTGKFAEVFLLKILAPAFGWTLTIMVFANAILLTFTTHLIILICAVTMALINLCLWWVRYSLLWCIAEGSGVHFVYDLNFKRNTGWHGMLIRILNGPFALAEVLPKTTQKLSLGSVESINGDERLEVSPEDDSEEEVEGQTQRRRHFLEYAFGTESTVVEVRRGGRRCGECQRNFCVEHKGERLIDERGDEFEDEEHVDPISVNLRLRANVRHKRTRPEQEESWVFHMVEFEAERFYFASAVPELFNRVMSYNPCLSTCVKFKSLEHTPEYSVHSRI